MGQLRGYSRIKLFLSIKVGMPCQFQTDRDGVTFVLHNYADPRHIKIVATASNIYHDFEDAAVQAKTYQQVQDLVELWELTR